MFKKLAKIKYLPNNFQVIQEGDHVICAISGKKIVDIVNKIKNNNIKQEFYLTDIVSLLKEEGGRTVFYESSSEELIGINDKKDPFYH